MSRKSDLARLERVLAFLSDIQEIVANHRSLEEAIADKEGQYALMLCLSQLGELLGKIESEDFVQRLPVRLAVTLRNVIVHDYEGLQISMIRNTISESLPSLFDTVQELLSKE